MSVGPLGGIAGSIAGSPLAKNQGTDVDRAQQETSAQQRQVRNVERADAAAGIGEANGEDHEAAERDADGRRLWEGPPEENAPEEESDDSEDSSSRQSKDASGQSGNLLDLSG